MARFGFSIPGRKKAPPPPITVTEPMTKAHKILGSVPLSIDSPKSWDGQSTANDGRTESRSFTSSARRQRTAGATTPASSTDQWGDESDIIPPSFKISATSGDDFTETSTVLRSKHSSSTIKSWYDKSKMPLSVTQQTSASAMAKGLPSKAQKMLDMENLHASPKAKKPSKLDNLLSGTWSPKQSHEPVLGADYMTRSPSLFSPPLSSGRRRRMLGKQNPKETLNGSATDEGRPSTSESSAHKGKGAHLNGLPDLYEHYEQMSFRQIMDADLGEDDEPADEPVKPSTNGLAILPVTQPLSSRPYDAQNMPTVQALLQQSTQRSLLVVPKPDQLVSEDSSSVSSRHTKTSRASVIAQSFQESDLQEKSVLMLSSDSEDDCYDEPETKSQKSILTRPISRIPETMALLEQGFVAGPATPNTADKRMSKSSKRASFAPSVTYLGVPGGQAGSLHTPDSQTTFAATGSASASSTRGSIISSSSVSSAPSWQTRSDKGTPDAYVVALLPSRDKTSSFEDFDDEETCDSEANLQRDTIIPQTDQPTPPLSPTSVDFYIRSAHSSVDGASAHNRFMAVTRQEEMLLSALRHKRQTMRESKMVNQQPTESRQPSQQPSQKHLSKASDATITNLLDFDFPAPPSSNESTPRLPRLNSDTPRQALSINMGTPQFHSDNGGQDTTSPILSPAPINPRQSQMFLKSSTYQPPEKEKKSYVSNAYAAPNEALDAEDLDELLSRIGKSNNPSPPRTKRNSRSSSSSSSGKSSRHERRLPKLAVGSNMDPVMESEDHAEAAGIPRPDSPISPSVFPLPPTIAPLNKRMARLSAVGGGRLGDAPGWWKDEEM